jgi:hypothetical protein
MGVPRLARDNERILRKGRGPGRYAPDDGIGRQAEGSRLGRRCYQSKSRGLIGCERAVDRLMAKMTNGASRLGRASVMMPNAPRSHPDQEQRQQRNRKNQIPNLFCLRHQRSIESKAYGTII